LFSISTKIKKSLGDVVVKDIKNTSLFRPRLLKKLKVSNEKLSKNRKTDVNAIAIFSMHTLIIKTKGVKPYTKSLTIKL